MSVLVNKDTRLVVQGITGSAGSFQCIEYGTNVVAGVTSQCIEYGTNVVAGVTPIGDCERVVKNFRTLYPCLIRSRMPLIKKVPMWLRFMTTSLSEKFAADSILEAIDAEIPLVIAITEW